MKTIALAADHAGYELKEKLKSLIADPEFISGSHNKIPKQVRDMQFSILDLGTNSTDSVDYPDFGKAAADAIASGKCELGIIICGSGIGISIAANRNPKVRAALCLTEKMAELSRAHNNANILALGARLVSEKEAKKIVEAFLNTEFEGGRHQGRVDKLGC